MEKEPIFHRRDLAERLGTQLVSRVGASGMFVTAPRRTGKSTFIREDLIPLLLEEHCVEVVYADLWEDRSANPGDVIVGAIKDRLLKHDGIVMRAAKASGVDKIKIGDLEMSLDRVGFGKGETLTKALRILAQAAGKPVVMVIDEAQHSQSSEEGRHALYALKAARDALNASDGPGFRLLATGSNSDKLATLVDDKDQAFYQAPMVSLPVLGRPYLEWLRGQQLYEPKPSIESMEVAFKMCNHRPEPLNKVLAEFSLQTGIDSSEIDQALQNAIVKSMARARSIFEQQINALSPLDAAVLKVMAQQGARFAPYAKHSYQAYQDFINMETSETQIEINQSTVQQALERLRSLQMIWRAGRGSYAIEDSQHMDWLKEIM